MLCPNHAVGMPCPAVLCCAVQATSAALGYLLLFIDQVGLIMGGPVLHESMYQGSTSSIWQPPGFWTRQPRSPSSVLPLNVLTIGQAAGAAAGQAAYSSSTNRYCAICGMHACMCARRGGRCMCAI
jgi:hypothetical protein